MLSFRVLKISMNEHTKLRVEAAAWEVPVLAAVHEAENVEDVGEVLVDRDPPEAADEFRRLAERYKKAEGSDVPFVAAVYGQFGVGTVSLARAIAAAVVDAPEVADEPQAEAAPAARSRKTKVKTEAPASDLV